MRLLPRHQFGLVQSHLFPKFFFLTTLFNFGSLSVFLKANPLPWSDAKLPLALTLTSSFILNVVNFTCFNPNAIKYNLKMHEIEKNAGEGLTTVGKLQVDTQCENNPVRLIYINFLIDKDVYKYFQLFFRNMLRPKRNFTDFMATVL
jgi:hypothetical protein